MGFGSSSDSSDDERGYKRVSSKKNKAYCSCEVIRKDSYATLSNIYMEATVNLGVLERIRLDVPMRTNCDVKGISVPKPKPAPVEQAKPKPVVPAAKVAYVGEVYKFTVEVKDLPRMDAWAAGGKADPYFYFYLDSRMYYGGRDTALRNTRNGHWSFPLVASEVKLAEKIIIKWMDWDTKTQDDEIGMTELNVTQAISAIRLGNSMKQVTQNLRISGKRSNSAVVTLIVEKQAEPKAGQTLNRTNSIRTTKK